MSRRNEISRLKLGFQGSFSIAPVEFELVLSIVQGSLRTNLSGVAVDLCPARLKYDYSARPSVLEHTQFVQIWFQRTAGELLAGALERCC